MQGQWSSHPHGILLISSPPATCSRLGFTCSTFATTDECHLSGHHLSKHVRYPAEESAN